MHPEIVDEIPIGKNITKLRFKDNFCIEQYNFSDEMYVFEDGAGVEEYQRTWNDFVKFCDSKNMSVAL